MYGSRMPQLPIVGDIHGFLQTFVELLDVGCLEYSVLQLADLSGRSGLRGDDLHDHSSTKTACDTGNFARSMDAHAWE